MATDEWVLAPVDPTVGDRSWSMTTDVEAECPRCGEVDLVRVIVWARTDGTGKLSMYAAPAEATSHDCDETVDQLLELDQAADLDGDPVGGGFDVLELSEA